MLTDLMKGTYLAPHLGQRVRHPQPWRTLIPNASKVDDYTATEGFTVIARNIPGYCFPLGSILG